VLLIIGDCAVILNLQVCVCVLLECEMVITVAVLFNVHLLPDDQYIVCTKHVTIKATLHPVLRPWY